MTNISALAVRDGKYLVEVPLAAEKFEPEQNPMPPPRRFSFMPLLSTLRRLFVFDPKCTEGPSAFVPQACL